jgi:hypothetical protein
MDKFSSTQSPMSVYRRHGMQGRQAGAPACMLRGARADAKRWHAQPCGAGFDRGSACVGRRRVFLARTCLHSRGGRRGLVQAAERIARAGTGRLGGLYVAAGRGPALDLVCMRTPAHGFGVGVQDGLLQGIGKRAQAPTRDHNQACSLSCDRAVFISLQMPTALAGLCALLSLPKMFSLSLPYLSPRCCHASG